jgi:hypothetical protein
VAVRVERDRQLMDPDTLSILFMSKSSQCSGLGGAGKTTIYIMLKQKQKKMDPGWTTGDDLLEVSFAFQRRIFTKTTSFGLSDLQPMVET